MATKKLKKKKVLIIDDESDVLETTTDYIVSCGFKVVSCFDPIEAMNLIDKEDFDAVITDYRMPQKNGLECLKHIKKVKGADFPVIFITGAVVNEEMLLKQGANDILHKPLDFAQLEDSLNRELQDFKLINPDDFQSIEIKSYAVATENLKGEKVSVSMAEFTEDGIVLEATIGKMVCDKEYFLKVECTSVEKSINFEFTGKIIEVEPVDKEVDMIVISPIDLDPKIAEEFQSVFDDRQNAITEFLRMTKGI